MLRLLRYVVLSFVFVVLSLGAAPADTAPPQIHVYSCRVLSGTPNVPVVDEIGLSVRFQNDSPVALASIVWRATYDNQAVDFIDDGEFSPNILIDNNVRFASGTAYINPLAAVISVATIFKPNPIKTTYALPLYAGTEDPENCTIVRIVRADGSLWMNPNVNQEARPFTQPTPLPAPDAVPSDPPDGAPIALMPCSLDIGRGVGLGVKYSNDSTHVADSIVFRATYEQSALDFTDRGEFAPGDVQAHFIKNPLPPELSGRSLYAHDDAQRCSVVSVHFADGTMWRNPALSATLPTPIPSAMPFNPMTARWSGRHGLPTPIPSGSPLPSATPS
jgi:hypothetical protein